MHKYRPRNHHGPQHYGCKRRRDQVVLLHCLFDVGDVFVQSSVDVCARRQANGSEHSNLEIDKQCVPIRLSYAQPLGSSVCVGRVRLILVPVANAGVGASVKGVTMLEA